MALRPAGRDDRQPLRRHSGRASRAALSRSSDRELIPTLLRPALTVAMLGAIESLMSAVVADRMGGDRHNPNVELVAQGIANIASPLFGGLPATGAIARTATNIRSGARTPVAGMVHALTLLVVLLVAAPLAALHPDGRARRRSCWSSSYNMGEWHEIPELLRLTKTDISVWLVTFALTVFADLTLAVEVGMILAALLFIRRVAATTTVSLVTPDYVEAGRVHILQDKPIPPYVTVFRIHGPFLFGVTDKVAHIIDHIDRAAAGRDRAAAQHDGDRRDRAAGARGPGRPRCSASGRTLHAVRRARAARRADAAAEFHHHVGERNICPNIEAALERADGDPRGEITEIAEITKALRCLSALLGPQRDVGIDPHRAPRRRPGIRPPPARTAAAARRRRSARRAAPTPNSMRRHEAGHHERADPTPSDTPRPASVMPSDRTSAAALRGWRRAPAAAPSRWSAPRPNATPRRRARPATARTRGRRTCRPGHREAPAGHRLADHLLHRPDAADRLVADPPRRTAARAGTAAYPAGRPDRAQHHDHLLRGVEALLDIDLRPERAVEPGVARVADDPGDGEPRAVLIEAGQLDLPADRVLRRATACRHRLVHDQRSAAPRRAAAVGASRLPATLRHRPSTRKYAGVTTR